MSTPGPSPDPRPSQPDGERRSPARHGQLRMSRPVGTVLKFLAAAVAVLLVSAGSLAAFAVWNITSAIAPGVALPGEEDGAAPTVGPIEGAANLLLVGSDSGGGNLRYGERGERLNDVTMLLHISADHTRATVVSFPRDLLVDLPACTDPGCGTEYAAVSYQKFNQSLSRGGLGCVAASVTALTGVPVQYAAKIEFDGVVAMSNAVGGVEVCVDTPINDRHTPEDPFVLEAGEHTLQGQDAFRFLQTRYGVSGGSDLARISNQQQFLSSLMRKLKDSATLADPVRLYGIASAASQNLEFSNSLRSADAMVSVALALKDIPLDDVVFLRYPIEEVSGGVVPIESAADEMIAAIQSDQPFTVTGGTGQGTELAEPAPSPSPDPSATSEPGTSVEPSTDPSAPAAIELPPSIEGVDASQQTCTRGQTAG